MSQTVRRIWHRCPFSPTICTDISALCYLGNEFINLFLKYYKNSDKDIEKRINMFIKAREVMSFENMVNNFPEEINEQIEKIKKVL